MQNNDNSYSFVYPSWATLSYKWSELEHIFSDPLTSGYVNPDENWSAMGYTEEPPIYELRGSPLGGGIISIEPRSPLKPLVRAALMTDTHFCQPVGPNSSGLKPATRYLEPMDGPLSAIPLAPKHLRKRNKSYTCITSVEKSLGATHDTCVFLLQGWSLEPILRDVIHASGSLGLPMSPLSLEAMASDITETTNHQLQLGKDLTAVFYQFDRNNYKLHFRYAVLVYLAYYVASHAKKKLVRATLFVNAKLAMT